MDYPDDDLSTVGGGLDQVDSASFVTGATTIIQPEGMDEEKALEVYKHYPFSHHYDQNLPITPYRQQVSETGDNRGRTATQRLMPTRKLPV